MKDLSRDFDAEVKCDRHVFQTCFGRKGADFLSLCNDEMSQNRNVYFNRETLTHCH